MQLMDYLRVVLVEAQGGQGLPFLVGRVQQGDSPLAAAVEVAQPKQEQLLVLVELGRQGLQ
jgi:hypothetical protein